MVYESFETYEMEGGNVKVFTGPKGGKFIIRAGKKVYLDRKSMNDIIKYNKNTRKK